MSGRVLFDLAPDWRLSDDNLQWIVESWRPPKWRAVAFVATEKAVLARVLREEGVALTPDARRALDQLPARFSEVHNKSPSAAATFSRSNSRSPKCPTRTGRDSLYQDHST